MAGDELYDFLAERMLACGITAEALESVATYRPGRSFADVKAIFGRDNPAASRGAEAGIASVARYLSDVIEIDPTLELCEVEAILKRAAEHTD